MPSITTLYPLTAKPSGTLSAISQAERAAASALAAQQAAEDAAADAAQAAAQLTALNLGTMATQSAAAVAIDGGTIAKETQIGGTPTDNPNPDTTMLFGESSIGPTIIKVPLNKILATKSLKQLGATSSMNATAIAALNLAMSAAAAAGTRRFDGLDATYTLTGNVGLRVPLGTELFGFELAASGMSSNTQILYGGGTLGSTSLLTADCNRSDVIEIADTSGYAEGDLVYIDSDKNFWSTNPEGELNRVRSIVDATRIWLDDTATFNFTTANNAKIRKIAASRDETIIRDGRIYGGNGVATNQYGILLQFADYGEIKNIETYNIGFAHIGIQRCYGVECRKNRMRRAEDIGLAYGYEISNGSRGTRIHGGDGAWMRHAATLGIGGAGGVNIDTEIHGFNGHHCQDAGIDGHPAYIGFKIFGGTFHGDRGRLSSTQNDGLMLQGVNTEVHGVTCIDFGGSGMTFQPLVTLESHFGGGVAIASHCQVEGCAGIGIDFQLAADATLALAQVTGGRVSNSGSSSAHSGIRVSVSANAALGNAIVQGVTLDNCGGSSQAAITSNLTTDGVMDRLSIIATHITGGGGRGLYVTNSGAINSVEVLGGSIDGPPSSDGAMFIFAHSGGQIGRARVSGTEIRNAAIGAYVRANGTSGGGSPVASLIGRADVESIVCRSVSGPNIWFLADSSGVITAARATGNDTNGGTYGLRVSGGGVAKLILPGDNKFTGASTPWSLTATEIVATKPDEGITRRVTVTGDYTVADGIQTIINNRAATNTLTMPNASVWNGRRLRVTTRQAQLVVSASSNVVPMDSATAGTAILPATAGAWCELESDGANWISIAKG